MLLRTVTYLGRVLFTGPRPAQQTFTAVSDSICSPRSSCLHTSATRLGLEEFFDDKDNYGKLEVRVGRSWLKDELRLKSNSDLHKLWYILLKERNMLLTMEEVYKHKLMPSPERIDKVEESMKNLEEVVRERNRAYFELETGETGERRCTYMMTRIGLWQLHKMGEHLIPKFMNKKWREENPGCYSDKYVDKFLALYREKLMTKKNYLDKEDKAYVLELLKRFPNLDIEYLQELYPNVDVHKMKNHKKARGHLQVAP